MANPSKKAQSSPPAGGSSRGSVFGAAFLIIGALCLRVFVLPARSVLPVKPILDDAQRKRVKQASAVLDKRERRSLPWNPGATMAQDIISMEHVPEESSVVVTLNADGRCPDPYLRGRLSGPALVMLEWSSSSSAKASTATITSKVGKYRVPISGTYFVEVIAVTCHDFSQDLDFDFQTTCVEDVLNHRLTKYNTKIYIDKDSAPPTEPASIISNNNIIGYWLHQQDERAANNDYAAMYTRFQPRGCMRLDDPTHEHFENPPAHCIEPTDLNRFEPYTTFQYYRPEKGSRVLRPSTLLPNNGANGLLRADKPTTVCLVGASHSRTLKASMERHHNISMENNNIQVEWINAKFPRNVNNDTIPEQMVGKCDKIIVGIGQWPASFSGGKPTLFQDYNWQTRRMLLRLQHFLGKGVDIFARTIHYNPLNAMISSYCPPRDWRSPTVVDGYNAIIRQACHDISAGKSASGLARISFVDTNFIVGPLWDASSDWGHVYPRASHVESWYLLAVAVGLIDPAQTI